MKRKFYYIPKRALLLIAGLVWMAAGFNVARIGIISYMDTDIAWYHIALSCATFCAFGTMFFMMTRKHARRIKNYEQHYRPFWNFFDIKAYIIMVIMMGGGIGLRAAHVFPNIFVAVFYSGLGCALFLAGVIFVGRFIAWKEEK